MQVLRHSLATFAALLAAPLASASAQCHLETEVNPTGGPGSTFATALALDGDRAAIGGTDAAGAPTVAIYERQSASDWLQVQTLANPDPAGLQGFGSDHVALDGDTLAVVAEPAAGGTGLPGPGVPSDTVFLFERQAGAFAPVGAFDLGLLLDGGFFDVAGVSSLALQGDTLAVTVVDYSVSFEYGSVRVFERSAGVWTPTATLQAPAGYDSTGFGPATALDGDRIVVEQWNAFAHSFVRTPSGWQYDQTETVFTCGDAPALDGLAAGGGRVFLGVNRFNDDCPAEIRVFEPAAVGGPLDLADTIVLPETWR